MLNKPKSTGQRRNGQLQTKKAAEEKVAAEKAAADRAAEVKAAGEKKAAEERAAVERLQAQQAGEDQQAAEERAADQQAAAEQAAMARKAAEERDAAAKAAEEKAAADKVAADRAAADEKAAADARARAEKAAAEKWAAEKKAAAEQAALEKAKAAKHWLALRTGMAIKITADKSMYAKECKASAVAAKLAAGAQGTIVNFNVKDLTALVITKGGDKAWVPIKALIGFDRIGQGGKVTKQYLKLKTGMKVRITKDKKMYEEQCKASGVPAKLGNGVNATVKDLNMKALTAAVATADGKIYWVPIRALIGFDQWAGIAKVMQTGKLVREMHVKITPDEKWYKAECEKRGVMASLEAGSEGQLKEWDPADGTALVTGDDDEGWVPINALVGFRDYVPGGKPGKLAEVVVEVLRAPASPPPPINWHKSDFVSSGCRRTDSDLFTYAKVGLMSLGRCFTYCSGQEGMKYFALTKGSNCICTKVPPGEYISSKHCDSKCSDNSKETCGGIAGATSVYTMIDCASPSPRKQQKMIEGRIVQMVDSYDSFDGEACGDAEDADLADLDGSPKLAGTLQECKVACWQAKGADVCRGFTYDKVQSKCTFHTDVSDQKRIKNWRVSCHFKKLGYEFDWSKKPSQ